MNKHTIENNGDKIARFTSDSSNNLTLKGRKGAALRRNKLGERRKKITEQNEKLYGNISAINLYRIEFLQVMEHHKLTRTKIVIPMKPDSFANLYQLKPAQIHSDRK